MNLVKDNIIEFSVYGAIVRGKYKSSNEDGSITIEVIYDEIDVCDKGEITNIHEMHLVTPKSEL